MWKKGAQLAPFWGHLALRSIAWLSPPVEALRDLVPRYGHTLFPETRFLEPFVAPKDNLQATSAVPITVFGHQNRR